MILCEIYRSYLPFWRGMPAKGAPTARSCAAIGRMTHPVAASGEFLLPSLHYSPCTVAATMKFVSFNINGLRARPHQLAAIVEKHQPDVIGLQETKVHDDMFPLEEVAGARL